jgi:hypothetical protein
MLLRHGTSYNWKCWICITAIFGYPGDRGALHAPASNGVTHMSVRISEKYRFKALVSEKLSRDATDFDIKSAWSDIAIEWHALANRTGPDAGRDRLLEYNWEPWEAAAVGEPLSATPSGSTPRYFPASVIDRTPASAFPDALLSGETRPRSNERLLFAYSECENYQSGHRQIIALIYQAARAEFFDDYRIVISQSSAAK